jgi:hypothetical protein
MGGRKRKAISKAVNGGRKRKAISKAVNGGRKRKATNEAINGGNEKGSSLSNFRLGKLGRVGEGKDDHTGYNTIH